MENKISVSLSQEEQDAILQKIEGMNKDMPFLVNLTKEERNGGFKMGDKNLGFLEKTRDYLSQYPEFLPSYYSIEEVQKDAALAGQMALISRSLRVLADKIEDTGSLAGMEALSGALAYYNTVKQARKDNADGANTIYEDLKTRFPGRPRTNHDA